MWKLRWHEDRIGKGGTLERGWSRTVHVGPSVGSVRLTEREARRIAWENFLSKLDAATSTPSSVMTVSRFVEQCFLPEHVAMLKRSGRLHYQSMLKHVLAGLGRERVRDVTMDQVQRLVSSLLRRNYSVQTAAHARNVVSAVFTHAKKKGWFAGENPASLVRLPEMVRKEAHALTFEQARALLEALKSPVRELVMFAILTSMNVAEVLGLQWKRVNLSEDYATVDGEPIPPMTIAVRRQWYRGEYGSVKARSRRRNIPIPVALRDVLIQMRQRKSWTGLEDPVFAARTGRPLDEHNIARRYLKPAGAKLGMPWLSWHCFRRTHTTLSHELGMAFMDRMAMMGHTEARMTALYTIGDLNRRREILEQMATKLVAHTEIEVPAVMPVQ